jgi:PHD-finger
MSCSVCKKQLPSDDNSIDCHGCKKTYHFDCSGVKKSTHLAKSAEKKANWRCTSCRGGKPSQHPDQPLFSSEAQFEEFKQEIRDEIKRELREGLKIFKEELINEVKSLKEKIKVLEEKVDDYADQIVRLEQYGRNKNIEIDNVEKFDNEVLEEVVTKLASAIKIDITEKDIDVVHRLPSRKNSEAPPKIIVQFTSRRKRDEFIAARSQTAPVTSESIVGGKNKARIYINENLTRYYKDLLWRAKQRAKEAGYQHIWFKYSKVLVRKSDTSQEVIRIFNFSDLDKIK